MAPKTKLFVSKLPPTCTDFELQKLFERIGEVTECSVMGNYAFIHMKTEDQAREAISSLNNWEMGSFKISVEQSTSEKRGGGGGGGGGSGSSSGRGRGMGFRGRGGFPPMRGGRGGSMGAGMGGGGGIMGRPGPYDRPPMGGDFYGPPAQPPMRNGYYDDYDRRPLPPPVGDRRPPPPMSREPISFRDSYDRFDDRYERMAPSLGRRSPPPMDRRMPIGYDRRDPYDDLYRRPLPLPERDMYGSGMDRYGPPRGRSPPRSPPGGRYGAPPRDLPPRRF